MRHAPAVCQGRCLCRSVAVEVGFEPTEDLRLHTLSSTAHHRSPPSASVRAGANTISAATGERWRTGVNETKTEPRAWCRGAAADRPACLPTAPIADVNPWTLNLASAGPSWAPSAVSSAAMKPDPCSSRTASAWQEGVCGGRLGPYPELVEQGSGLPAELIVPDPFGDEVDPGSVDKRDERGLVHQLVIDPCP